MDRVMFRMLLIDDHQMLAGTLAARVVTESDFVVDPCGPLLASGPAGDPGTGSDLSVAGR